MRKHISIFSFLLCTFAAAGLIGTAEGSRIETCYRDVDGKFNSGKITLATDSTPFSGGDFTATPDSGKKVAEWWFYDKDPTFIQQGDPDAKPVKLVGTDNPQFVSVSDAVDCFLVAHFAWITYKVKYDANGGTGAPSEVTGNSYNKDFTVSSTVPTKSGYTFVGWKADSNGKTYAKGTSVVGSELCKPDWHDDNQVVTLTAQWTKERYTISTAVEPTGAGSVTGGGTYDFGAQVKLTATANSGWKFEKWKDGSTDNPRTVTVGAAAATYTAVFTSKSITVTFDPNGGNAPSSASKSVTYLGTYGTLATCSRAGYTFADWWTAATGGSKVTPSTQVATASDHTLYAHWTANEYSLTVNPNGGSYEGQTIEQKLQEKLRYDAKNLNAISVATRENYTLSGYYTSSSGGTKVYDGNGHNVKCDYWTAAYPNGTFKGTSDLRVYAIWKPNASTVTLDKQGGTGGADTVSVTYDTTVPAITSLPTRAGYAFEGYYAGKNGSGRKYYNANGEGLEKWTSTGTTVLYANWTPNGYKVQYELNGGSTGTDAPSSAKVGTAFRVSTPTRAGYTFTGWNVTGAAADYTTAKWGVASDAASTAIPNASTVCFSPQYSFVYFLNLTMTQNATVTLKANWKANEYGVAVDANGGSGGSCESYTVSTSNQTKTVALPTKGGYSISGWTVSGASGETPTVSGTTLTIPAGTYGKLTLKPTWTANNYEVAVDANGGSGGSCPSYTVSTSQQTKTITLPTKTGCSIVSWNVGGATGGTPTVSGTALTIPSGTYGDLTLTPSWTANRYTVTLNKNGGTCADLTGYTYGDGATLPAATKTGYTFDGWYANADFTGGPVTTIGKTDTGNKTFYAKFTGNYYEIGYDNIFSVTDWIQSDSALPSAPARTDVRGDIPDGSIRVTARVADESNHYTSFVRGPLGGRYASWCNSNTRLKISFKSLFDADIPVKAITVWWFYYDAGRNFISDDGYTHSKSFSGDGVHEVTATSPANAKYVSVFFAMRIDRPGLGVTISDISIRRGAGDFDIVEPARKLYQYSGGKLGDLAVPVKTGYTFVNWTDTDGEGGTEVTRDTAQYAISKTIHSHWKANGHTVTFNGTGGTPSPTSKTVTYDSTYGDLATCTRTGYTFGGWWTAASGGTKVESTTKVALTANQTLYAHWTANSYTVRFDRNGGDGSMADQPFTYDMAQDLRANAFTKAGYGFAGWNTKLNGSGTSYADEQNVKNLASDPNATVTLYAQWQAGTYTVTFNANGGTTSTPSKNVTHGSTYGTLPTCTRKGYDFKGWWTAKEGGTEITGATTVELTAAQTLFAHWEAKKYKVTIILKDGESYTDALGRHSGPDEYDLQEPLVFGKTNLNQIAVATKTNNKDYSIFLGYKVGGTTVYNGQGRNLKGPLGTYWTADYPTGTFCHDGDLKLTIDWQNPNPHYTIDVAPSSAEAGTVTGAGIYEEGSNVVLTATVTDPGYSFAYWNRTNDNQVAYGNPLEFPASANAGYLAVFTGNVYTVTFMDTHGGTPPGPISVTYGKQYGELPESTYANPDLQFSQWLDSTTGNPIHSTNIVRISSKFINIFVADEPTERPFQVTFFDPIGKKSALKECQRNPPVPIGVPPPETAQWDHSKEGYWQDPNDKWDPPLTTLVTSNMTVNAKWTSIADVLDCTNLTFSVDSGTTNWVVCTNDHVVGNSCMKLVFSEGRDNLSTTIPGAGTLSFNWKIDSGNLHASTNGSNDVWSREEGRKWTKTEKEELVFPGPCNLTFYSLAKGPRSCLIDNVTWTPGIVTKKHTVTFTDSSGTFDDEERTVNEGEGATAPEWTSDKFDPTACGWDKDFSKVMKDIIVNAVWTCRVSFVDEEGGNQPETKHVEYNGSVTAPQWSRTGYTFGGWNPALPEKVTENITVKAVWNPIYHKVTFKDPSGTCSADPQQVAYGQGATAPEWTSDKFDPTTCGWSRDFSKVMEDIEVSAVWTCRVVFVDQAGGNAPVTNRVEYGTVITEGPNFTAPTDYHFGGWDPALPLTALSNTTVSVIWTQDPMCTVTFHDPSGTFADVKSKVAVGGTAIAPDWKTSKFKSLAWDKPFGPINADTTVSAVWACEIKFVDETFPRSPDTQEVTFGNAVTVPLWQQTGYTLKGWQPAFETTASSNSTYAAVWAGNVYTVTFDAKGGSAVPDQKVTYGQPYGTLEKSELVGFNFIGWFLGETEIKPETPVSTSHDHTLVAKWKQDMGEVSAALDCNNLAFEKTGGWTIENDHGFAYTEKGGNDLYLKTTSVDAGSGISATVKESGTLTFHWRALGNKSSQDATEFVFKVNGEEVDRLSNYSDNGWMEYAMKLNVPGEPVTISFVCEESYGYCALDFITWAPEGGGKPTPGDPVEVTEAGVVDGVFKMTIWAENETDYGVWTNADLTVDSWGLMGEPQPGKGQPMEFKWTILPGFPQLFFRAHEVEYK